MVESSASDTALMHMPVSSTFFGVNRSVSFPMKGPSTPINNSTIDPPAEACAAFQWYVFRKNG